MTYNNITYNYYKNKVLKNLELSQKLMITFLSHFIFKTNKHTTFKLLWTILNVVTLLVLNRCLMLYTIKFMFYYDIFILKLNCTNVMCINNVVNVSSFRIIIHNTSILSFIRNNFLVNCTTYNVNIN